MVSIEKKLAIVIFTVLVISGTVFAQERIGKPEKERKEQIEKQDRNEGKYDGSKKNSILATATLLGGGIHYEHSLNKTWTVGAEFETDWFFFLWGDVTANIFARWYPTQKAMFVELGLGYASGFSSDGFTYLTTSTVIGADIKAKFGWKLDVGKPGGLVIEPAVYVGVILGAKTVYGYDGGGALEPGFGAKVFFSPVFSLGWTF